MGTYLLGTETLGWVTLCGAGIPYPQDILPKFLFTTGGYGTSPFRVSVFPTLLPVWMDVVSLIP